MMNQLIERTWTLKSNPSGENFIRLALFTESQGLVYALKRITKTNKNNTNLDLFDLGTIHLERAKQGDGWFFKSFDLERRHTELGKDYKRLEAAALYANFLIRNLVHIEDFSFTWQLTEQLLDAILHKPQPKVAAFKAFYRFAREEGYAVKEEWIPQLSPTLRIAALDLVHSPLDAIATEPKNISLVLDNLFTYFNRSTDIIAPSG